MKIYYFSIVIYFDCHEKQALTDWCNIFTDWWWLTSEVSWYHDFDANNTLLLSHQAFTIYWLSYQLSWFVRKYDNAILRHFDGVRDILPITDFLDSLSNRTDYELSQQWNTRSRRTTTGLKITLFHDNAHWRRHQVSQYRDTRQVIE
jgi:hypothetical protein